MNIFKDKDKKDDDATKPLQVEETKTGKPLDVQAENDAETPKENVEDRAVFNCGNCNGDGLVLHAAIKTFERCPACAGTGRVN